MDQRHLNSRLQIKSDLMYNFYLERGKKRKISIHSLVFQEKIHLKKQKNKKIKTLLTTVKQFTN